MQYSMRHPATNAEHSWPLISIRSSWVLTEPFRITVDYLPIAIHCGQSTVILNGSTGNVEHQNLPQHMHAFRITNNTKSDNFSKNTEYVELG
jgi:hypothetical protein